MTLGEPSHGQAGPSEARAHRDREGHMSGRNANGKAGRVVLKPARRGTVSPSAVAAAVKKVKAILKGQRKQSVADGTQ
jgi:hypothetical protein